MCDPRSRPRVRRVIEVIAKRRCLLCSRFGSEHHVRMNRSGRILVLGTSPQMHVYDPGDRRFEQ